MIYYILKVFMSYYSLLEIHNDSSINEIKKAYRKLALKYHPDKNKSGTNDKFIKITNAYQVLIDPKSRIEYDNKINNGFSIDDNIKNMSNLTTKMACDIFLENINELFKKFIVNTPIHKQQVNFNNVKYRSFVINYNLEEHLNKDFYKIIEIKLDNYTKQINVNTTIHNQTIELVIPETNQIYFIEVTSNCNKIDNYYYDYTNGNIFHTIFIDINAFINGFYYTLHFYGKLFKFKFNTPYKGHLLYKYSGLGSYYNIHSDHRGDLFFILKISKITTKELSELEILKLENNNDNIIPSIIVPQDIYKNINDI